MTPPDKIYLQVEPEDGYDVTWERDRINDSDVEYTLSSSIINMQSIIDTGLPFKIELKKEGLLRWSIFIKRGDQFIPAFGRTLKEAVAKVVDSLEKTIGSTSKPIDIYDEAMRLQ